MEVQKKGLREGEDSKKIVKSVSSIINSLVNIFKMFVNHEDNTISGIYTEKELLTLHQNTQFNVLAIKRGVIFELESKHFPIQGIEICKGYRSFEVKVYNDAYILEHFTIPPASVFDSLFILLNRDVMYFVAEKSRFKDLKNMLDDIYMLAGKIIEIGSIFREVKLKEALYTNPILIAPNIGNILNFISVAPYYNSDQHKYQIEVNVKLKINDDEIAYHIPDYKHNLYMESLAKLLLYFGAKNEVQMIEEKVKNYRRVIETAYLLSIIYRRLDED